MGTSGRLFCPAHERTRCGGASRDRTGDLYNAIVALSQLSYGPSAAAKSRHREYVGQLTGHSDGTPQRIDARNASLDSGKRISAAREAPHTVFSIQTVICAGTP